eukprot:Nk52_evm9s233 gene=Nk52_evmTU9s233
MKLKELQSHLEDVAVFESPKIQLEQYPTNPHLAAQVLRCIWEQYGDIRGKVIADLGCGCGMLSIGCGLLGSKYVLGLDIDQDALQIARMNYEDYFVEEEEEEDKAEEEEEEEGEEEEEEGEEEEEEEEDDDARRRAIVEAEEHERLKKAVMKLAKIKKEGKKAGANEGKEEEEDVSPEIDFVLCDVVKSKLTRAVDEEDGVCTRMGKMYIGDSDEEEEDEKMAWTLHKAFDVVIMNPPFGTKNNAGIDMDFLDRAIAMSRGSVYSFHKSSTRDFIIKRANKAYGYKATVVAEMKFDIPQMYRCHKKKNVSVAVDLLKFRPA